MRQRILLPFLVFPVFALSTAASPPNPNSTQARSTTMSQRAASTHADMKVLRTKAHRGDVGAQFWLGVAYQQGWPGKTDIQKALEWFRRAAARGNPDAQNSLGRMYEDGEGVEQNHILAAEWYRKAADHVPDLGGAGQGRNNLGLLYMKGLGVPKDYIQAYMWFSLANSGTNLSYARAQMTPAQILEAERMAKEWKSHHAER